MPRRPAVGPRFELFLALAEILRPERGDTPWLAQARRKLDPSIRRRMGDLASAPGAWIALAAVPGTAALQGDADSVIAALADLPADDFARRFRAALPEERMESALQGLIDQLAHDPAGLQRAAVDALRRFDRLAFAALWRRIVSDLEEAAAKGTMPPSIASEDAIVFPTMFGAHRFQLGKSVVETAPVEQWTAPLPRAATSRPAAAQDPEAVFRALGDATRYAIARMIAREALTGADLARRLGVSGPTLTHHLKALRRAHLVIEERRGNRILLRLDRRTIELLSTASLETLFADLPFAIRRSRRNHA